MKRLLNRAMLVVAAVVITLPAAAQSISTGGDIIAHTGENSPVVAPPLSIVSRYRSESSARPSAPLRLLVADDPAPQITVTSSAFSPPSPPPFPVTDRAAPLRSQAMIRVSNLSQAPTTTSKEYP